ncbi:uncharacterized protein LOC121431436 [Lytechinus variegatus]|uniref:uncharacterized protein LOC121431436 n=1 Tax=Lytechinus variegatus TaxID=7654 RepID=UPI001BB14F66|nr:uncharacterized protein LOC121431436 [Lytechinus variegatus]
MDLGRGSILTQVDERALVEHLHKLSSYGYGLTKTQVIHLATNMADELGRREGKAKGRLLSDTWYRLFRQRWPDLRLVAPSKLQMSRAKSTTAAVLSSYFEELRQVMDRYDLRDKPYHIYNVDETNINAEHKPPKVVCGDQGSRTNAITSHRIATTTVLACGNAAGRALPPYYVFKGKRMMPELMDGALPGSKMTLTETGWSNGAVFSKFLTEHFVPSLPPREDGEYVLLMYDGHTSHISTTVIDFARANQVILFVLPAHTSHITQPLDVACFSAMKSAYNQECALYMQKNPGQVITRYEIAWLSLAAYLRALKEENLKAAFRKTGIFPLDPNAVKIGEVSKTSTLVTPTSSTTPSEEKHQIGPMGDMGEAQGWTNQTPSEADLFLSSRTPSPPEATQKKRAVSKKYYRASGVSITENNIFLKLIRADEERSKAKLSKGKEKKATSQAGPSSSAAASRRLFVNLPTSDDTDDEEDENPCCVCRRNTPPHPPQDHVEIFSWVACDRCTHWVHQKYCTGSSRKFGKDDVYMCPCH